MKTPMKSIATLLGRGVIGLQRSSTPSGHVPRFLELVTLSMIRSTVTGEFMTYLNRFLSRNSATSMTLALG